MDDPAEVSRDKASQADVVADRLVGRQDRTDLAHGRGQALAPILTEGQQQRVHLRARPCVELAECPPARLGQRQEHMPPMLRAGTGTNEAASTKARDDPAQIRLVHPEPAADLGGRPAFASS